MYMCIFTFFCGVILYGYDREIFRAEVRGPSNELVCEFLISFHPERKSTRRSESEKIGRRVEGIQSKSQSFELRIVMSILLFQ